MDNEKSNLDSLHSENNLEEIQHPDISDSNKKGDNLFGAINESEKKAEGEDITESDISGVKTRSSKRIKKKSTSTLTWSYPLKKSPNRT